jgi:sporulation-control protein
VEVESGDVAFHTVRVAGSFTLAAGEERTVPFTFPVPFETPLTTVYGQQLRGITMGLRTALSVARAVDRGDLGAVSIHPLPAQARILQALGELGFRFRSAGLERGRIAGVAQQLPFYQEIAFYPPPYAHGVNQVEVTFVAAPHGMDVILAADRRGGLFTAGHDAYGHLRVDYAAAEQTDWAARIDGWLRGVVRNRPSGPGYRARGYGHRRLGHGRSGVAAGAVAGLVGGVVAGERIDDAFGGEGGGDVEE